MYGTGVGVHLRTSWLVPGVVEYVQVSNDDRDIMPVDSYSGA